MLFVRGALSIFMVLVGSFVVVQMLHYPLAQSFTGIVLGAAMILLGALRLRQIREVMRQR
jgi:hypothetical protein